MSAINQTESAARHKLEKVARFMNNAQLPGELRRRAAAHLRTVLLHKRIVLNWRDLLRELSLPLQNEVALHLLSPLLMSPKIAGYFRDEAGEVDPAFIKMLVMRFELTIFAPADYIIEVSARTSRPLTRPLLALAAFSPPLANLSPPFVASTPSRPTAAGPTPMA